MKKYTKILFFAFFGFVGFLFSAGSASADSWPLVNSIGLSGSVASLSAVGLTHDGTNLFFTDGDSSKLYTLNQTTGDATFVYVHPFGVDCIVTPLQCPRLGGLGGHDGFHLEVGGEDRVTGEQRIYVVDPTSGEIQFSLSTVATSLITGLDQDSFTGLIYYSWGTPYYETIDKNTYTPGPRVNLSHGENSNGIGYDSFSGCFFHQVDDSEAFASSTAIVQNTPSGVEVRRSFYGNLVSDVTVSRGGLFGERFVWIADDNGHILVFRAPSGCANSSAFSYARARCELNSSVDVRVEWLTIQEIGITTFSILRSYAQGGPYVVVANNIPATGPLVTPYSWLDVAPMNPQLTWYKVRTNTGVESELAHPLNRCRY